MSHTASVLAGVPVHGSQGGCLGYAAGLEDGDLLVDCDGARGDRLHLPLEWVTEFGDTVHLCKTCNEARAYSAVEDAR